MSQIFSYIYIYISSLLLACYEQRSIGHYRIFCFLNLNKSVLSRDRPCLSHHFRTVCSASWDLSSSSLPDLELSTPSFPTVRTNSGGSWTDPRCAQPSWPWAVSASSQVTDINIGELSWWMVVIKLSYYTVNLV